MASFAFLHYLRISCFIASISQLRKRHLSINHTWFSFVIVYWNCILKSVIWTSCSCESVSPFMVLLVSRLHGTQLKVLCIRLSHNVSDSFAIQSRRVMDEQVSGERYRCSSINIMVLHLPRLRREGWRISRLLVVRFYGFYR